MYVFNIVFGVIGIFCLFGVDLGDGFVGGGVVEELLFFFLKLVFLLNGDEDGGCKFLFWLGVWVIISVGLFFFLILVL